jgi:hypothetical protein
MNFLPQLMKESQLTPNQLYLLYCFYVEEKPLYINMYTELRGLQVAGYVSTDGRITNKGVEVAAKIPVSKKTASKKPAVVITEDSITQYLDLFPKGKLPSGKLARSDRKNIKTSFEWFFKNHEYTWDVVIRATALYVDEYEKKNYMYMKTSQYFISKMNPDRTRDSELANYCSSVVNNDYETDENFFSEKVV